MGHSPRSEVCTLEILGEEEIALVGDRLERLRELLVAQPERSSIRIPVRSALAMLMCLNTALDDAQVSP